MVNLFCKRKTLYFTTVGKYAFHVERNRLGRQGIVFDGCNFVVKREFAVDGHTAYLGEYHFGEAQSVIDLCECDLSLVCSDGNRQSVRLCGDTFFYHGLYVVLQRIDKCGITFGELFFVSERYYLPIKFVYLVHDFLCGGILLTFGQFLGISGYFVIRT